MRIEGGSRRGHGATARSRSSDSVTGDPGQPGDGPATAEARPGEYEEHRRHQRDRYDHPPVQESVREARQPGGFPQWIRSARRVVASAIFAHVG